MFKTDADQQNFMVSNYIAKLQKVIQTTKPSGILHTNE